MIAQEPSPFAFGGPCLSGRLRERPEDFQVDELLGFEPEGVGEYVLLHIAKTSANTGWVAKRLAQIAGVPPREVGYAGLKDRNAVTTQWFSVRIPARSEPDWGALAVEGVEVLERTRDREGLRPGTLEGNRFRIRVRGCTGDREVAEVGLRRIAAEGMPNYFGEQRFGRDGANLGQALRIFRNEMGRGEVGRGERDLRGIYLSAARSYLFNRVLAARVEEGCWGRPIAGDCLWVEGRGATFGIGEPDAGVRRRALDLEVHPTGPLWGKGPAEVTNAALAMEQAALGGLEEWCAGLEAQGLRMDRRPLRARVGDLHWRWEGGDLELLFSLPAGSYATALLREVVAPAGEPEE